MPSFVQHRSLPIVSINNGYGMTDVTGEIILSGPFGDVHCTINVHVENGKTRRVNGNRVVEVRPSNGVVVLAGETVYREVSGDDLGDILTKRTHKWKIGSGLDSESAIKCWMEERLRCNPIEKYVQAIFERDDPDNKPPSVVGEIVEFVYGSTGNRLSITERQVEVLIRSDMFGQDPGTIADEMSISESDVEALLEEVNDQMGAIEEFNRSLAAIHASKYMFSDDD